MFAFFLSDIWVNFLPTGRGHGDEYKGSIIYHISFVLQERTALLEGNLMSKGQAGPLVSSRAPPGNKNKIKYAFQKADNFAA